MRSASALLVFFLATVNCTHYPESYAPPLQRSPIGEETAFGYRSFMEMNDRSAENHFLRDIRALEGNAWRWTGPRPTLRFVLEDVDGLKLLADYAVPSVTLEQTGPVTVSFYVNDKLLGQRRHETSGQYQFEQPVETAWLVPNEDTIVAIDIDPPWGADDGTKLGFILLRVGFVE